MLFTAHGRAMSATLVPTGQRRCCNPYNRTDIRNHKMRAATAHSGRWLCGTCRQQCAREATRQNESQNDVLVGVHEPTGGEPEPAEIEQHQHESEDKLNFSMEASSDTEFEPIEMERQEIAQFLNKRLKRSHNSPFKKRYAFMKSYTARKVRQALSTLHKVYSARNSTDRRSCISRSSGRRSSSSGTRSSTRASSSSQINEDIVDIDSIEQLAQPLPCSPPPSPTRMENAAGFNTPNVEADDSAAPPALVAITDTVHQSRDASITTSATAGPQCSSTNLFDDNNDSIGSCSHNCNILNELVTKFQNASSQNDKMKILVIACASGLSDRLLTRSFGCCHKTVAKARRIYEKDGILAQPDPREYDRVPEEHKRLAKEFYNIDDFSSRPMTGTRDFVKGVPKRLLMLSLRELYVAFKVKYPEVKMGFSTFCDMRPKHCVFAGGRGTLNICVCLLHQNPKLMLEGARIFKLSETDASPMNSYQDVLRVMVCDMDSAECRLGRCARCPGAAALEARLTQLFAAHAITEVRYRQWETVDRCAMNTIVAPVEEFIAPLVEKMKKLRDHCFISKRQSRHAHMRKDTLKENEVLVQGDYSENFQMVAQDAPQGWHWSKTMATIHPFVVYYKEADTIKHFSHVVISNHHTHNTAAVHLFQGRLVQRIKEKVGPHITDITYFSDGCAAQYKNKSNFLNVTMHQKDFGMRAEWHFFATSHGKGPCDGVGGSVKRLAARACIQGSASIQTANELYEYIKVAMPDTVFDYTDIEEHERHEEELRARFAGARTLPGTQGFHCIKPREIGSVTAQCFSDSEDFKVALIKKFD